MDAVTTPVPAPGPAVGMPAPTSGFDFDAPVERFGTDCCKWDECAPGELPMWVADMDFPTAPAVRAAIEARAAQGVFGYALVPDAWYDAYIGWWEARHAWRMEREWLAFATGVVPIVSSVVRKLTTPAEKVLIQTPTYNVFYNSILNAGRRVLESPLVYHAPGPDAPAGVGGGYEMDFDDLERKLADPQTTLMILCNPANPSGSLWDRPTLARVGELAAANGVVVLSDEIHCDLTDPGTEYVPFASVSETCRDNCVVCLAPTKTFNIAGLHTAAVCVPNPHLRARVVRALNSDEVAEPSVFSCGAAVAAFGQGAPWLDALRAYVARNKRLVRSTLAERLPGVRAVPGPATYLVWLDCAGLPGVGRTGDARALNEHIRRETGLVLCPGAQYGGAGAPFLRMNVATQRVRVEDGLSRLARGCASWGARCGDC